MMKRSAKLLLTALALLILAGCAGQPVNLGNVSSLEQIDTSRGEQLSASASGFQLLLFIPISINNRQKKAYDALVAQAKGRALSNVKITESWTYAFVGTLHTTKIEATAYPRKP